MNTAAAGRSPAAAVTGMRTSMKFMTAVHTDVGIKKTTNQDSLLVQEAVSGKYGPILFAAVCDGMGGLQKGELASAELVRALANWFRASLPALLEAGFQPEKLREDWARIIREQDFRISDYGDQQRIKTGTTVTALLLIGQNYYIVNVGDSRVYLLSDRLYQLTKDHTVVQREIDQGQLTPEQAAVDPRRSVLLQCVGVSDGVAPDFFAGTVTPRQSFLLCCDGFRHVLAPAEIYQQLNYQAARKESVMQERLVYLTELNKQRGEQDNISAILVRVS